MPRGILVFAASVSVAGVLAVVAGAQARQSAQQRFTSGVELVNVSATVTDADGRLVTGLTRDDFEILEDGVPQTLTQFTDARLPVSLGILVDVSDSMYGRRIEDARAALDIFVRELLDPGDEAFLMTFNHGSSVIASWTTPPARVTGRLGRMKPFGGTAIYDALISAAPIFELRRHQRAAAVVISDGDDTASDHTLSEVRTALRRSDTFVYAIAIEVWDRRALSTRVNPHTLRVITTDSGGYTEVIHDSPELADATARIAHELNNQYTLGYTPHRGPDGRYRSIRVKARRRDLTVRARRGYVATTERRR